MARQGDALIVGDKTNLIGELIFLEPFPRGIGRVHFMSPLTKSFLLVRRRRIRIDLGKNPTVERITRRVVKRINKGTSQIKTLSADSLF